MNKENLKISTLYRGEHKGVRFEIVRFDSYSFDYNREYNWCYYIYINLDKQIEDKKIADSLWLKPKVIKDKHISYDYYDSIVGKIYFHGGCTFYSKESSVDNIDRLIKIGCDFQHYADDGQEYYIQYVLNEAKFTIDSFIENISPIKKHCSGCGVYFLKGNDKGCGKCEYTQEDKINE